MIVKAAGAIIAGGLSSRMGADKTKLVLNKLALLEHAEKLLHQAGLDSILISHKEHIVDRFEGRGPLAGIDAVLASVRNEITHVLFIPVDMPNLSPAILKILVEAPFENQVVRFSDFAFPFRLSNSTFAASEVERRLVVGNRLSLMDFQTSLYVTELAVPENCESAFANVNTQSDWQKLLTSKGENDT